ncbi:FAD-dependent oxidoreductase [Lentzea sp. NBRC 105346]|uniref:FAD-dependent monooxygenase n=1 Tax=Lentzea sp. NBRC 105346 TaxID=3032205 RepID=UPI00249FB7EC|nr:FAD-dependent monooxygenase [Lentzea sp. NBRC 105346]GLZ36306.1 FAD-dependent oxidoreductase [Lentzea sp. NBRC 105346]
MSDEKTAVLVVGGGLAGLSAAAFLAWQDVPVLLVESHADLLIHPRSRGITPRTSELLRQLGIEQQIIDACGLDATQDKMLSLRASTLSDPDFVTFGEGEAAKLAEHSPSQWSAIDQDRLEVILRDRARELGADIRFSTELKEFEQGDNGVTAVIEDLATGKRSTISADYIVAADGNSSPIRERLGIPALGPGRFAEVASVMFEGDLSPVLAGRPVGVAYVEKPRPGTVLVRTAPQRWVATFAQEETEYDEAAVVADLHAAIGEDLDVRVLPQVPGTDLKQLWFVIGAQVAQEFRRGRVFLVGDAAHIVPPALGQGGSMAIQDSNNLAWKLAAVHRGHAGDALLDTYDAERKPVAFNTMGIVLAAGQARNSGQEPDDIDVGALVFGYQYRSSAVLGAEGAPDAVPAEELTGQAGTRAPHLDVTIDGKPASTIDLYGPAFVLITGEDGAAWADAARTVSGDTGVRIDIADIGGRLGQVDKPIGAAHGITSTGALLVRPDGFVAWRSPDAAGEPEQELRAVLNAVLA